MSCALPAEDSGIVILAERNHWEAGCCPIMYSHLNGQEIPSKGLLFSFARTFPRRAPMSPVARYSMVAPREKTRNPCRAFVILQSSLSSGRGTFCGSSCYRESDPQFPLRGTVAPLPIRRNQQHYNGHLARTSAQQPRRASRTASCAHF
jgi:hypothetical protein